MLFLFFVSPPISCNKTLQFPSFFTFSFSTHKQTRKTSSANVAELEIKLETHFVILSVRQIQKSIVTKLGLGSFFSSLVRSSSLELLVHRHILDIRRLAILDTLTSLQPVEDVEVDNLKTTPLLAIQRMRGGELT